MPTLSIPVTEIGTQHQDAAHAIAEKAHQAFEDASRSVAVEDDIASFTLARSLIEQLWDLAPQRERGFRDLLALVDAAIRRARMENFSPRQRGVLSDAISLLRVAPVQEADVDSLIERFAEVDIDLLGPLRPLEGKRVRLTFEVLDA